MAKITIEIEKKEDCDFALRVIEERWGGKPSKQKVTEPAPKGDGLSRFVAPEVKTRTRTAHRPWTDRELDYLRKNKDDPLKVLSKKLGRTIAAVAVRKTMLNKEE